MAKFQDGQTYDGIAVGDVDLSDSFEPDDEITLLECKRTRPDGFTINIPNGTYNLEALRECFEALDKAPVPYTHDNIRGPLGH